MKPYYRTLILCTAFMAVALLVPKMGWAACPTGQFEWNYWYGGTSHVTCGCTTANADIDPVTKQPTPWIVDKAIQVYITGGGTWTYATTGGVKTPWYYAENNGYLNGVPNGFTTTAYVKPIGSDTNYYTTLADTQPWVATKTIPTYVTGQRLGTTYKNYPGTVTACNLATAGGVQTPPPIINASVVAPKTIAGSYGSICALNNGKVTCTVLNNETPTDPYNPSLLTAFSATVSIGTTGDRFVCGLQTDTTVKCVNAFSTDHPYYLQSLSLGQTLSFYGPAYTNYTSVIGSGQGLTNIVQTAFTTGSSFGCVLFKDGTIRCGSIGSPYWDKVTLQDVATQITIAQNSLCVLLKSGAVQCSSKELYQSPVNPSLTLYLPQNFTPVFTSGATNIVSTDDTTCAVVNGNAQCWKSGAVPQPVSILSPATTLLASHQLVCASINGGMKCINPSIDLTKTVAIPYGVDKGFSEIASTTGSNLKYVTTCTKTADKIRCWGNDPKAMGSFENMNGKPSCNGSYTSCTTSFGLGLGTLTANPEGTDTTLTCKVFQDTPEVPQQFISCNNGIPSLKFPSPVCSSYTQTLPTCDLGSARCDSNSSIACGGFIADTATAPFCKQGFPTCVKGPTYGLPSCLVADNYGNPASSGCADIYGKKLNTYLTCAAEGAAQCSGYPSYVTSFTISCPSPASASDQPKCVPNLDKPVAATYGSPTCANSIPVCSGGNTTGSLICDNYGTPTCGSASFVSIFHPVCGSLGVKCEPNALPPAPVEPYTPPAPVQDPYGATSPSTGSKQPNPKTGSPCEWHSDCQDNNPCNGVDICPNTKTCSINSPTAADLAGWTCTN